MDITRVLIATLFLAPVVGTANPKQGPEVDYENLIISYLTARECGLDDSLVTAAFSSTVLELHASRNISASAGRRIRKHANASFRRNWSEVNDRARCASEGKAAAAWLLKLLDRD